jgi:hypothetical protein
MKRTVLVFGFISGGLMCIFMAGTMFFVKDIGFDKGEIVGYTGMVLAFLLVFFGIRSYRENVGGGKISFGRALAVGMLIMLISSACYVGAWEVIYFKFMHASMQDFVEKYQTHEVEKVRNSGGGEAAVQAKLQEMKKMMALYENPFFNSAITFLEPLPPGLIITLISALVLRKRGKPANAGALPATQAAT